MFYLHSEGTIKAVTLNIWPNIIDVYQIQAIFVYHSKFYKVRMYRLLFFSSELEFSLKYLYVLLKLQKPLIYFIPIIFFRTHMAESQEKRSLSSFFTILNFQVNEVVFCFYTGTIMEQSFMWTGSFISVRDQSWNFLPHDWTSFQGKSMRI